MSGGNNTTATTQRDTERGVGLVLLHPLPSLHAQIPAYGVSTLRRCYLGKNLVYTSKYGGIAKFADRSRGKVDRATDCGRGEAVAGARNGGQETEGVGYESRLGGCRGGLGSTRSAFQSFERCKV